jgi:lipid-binding SYLF domain-containing protein
LFKDKNMKIVSIVVASALVLTSANVFAASGREDSVERLQAAADVLHSIQEAPDHGIPNSVFDDAKCIIVVPHLIKGGFIFGAKHGRGVATCRTPDGWSAPAFISIGGGSWGLQIGVEEVDLVMLVMNDRGVQHLLSSKFELSGEGAVAAGPVGRQAVAGTDWKLNTEILSYSRTKGVFAGLTLEGAVVEQDNDSTWAIYDHEPSFRHVLSGGIEVPASADVFIKEVKHDAERAREENK